MTKLNNAAFAVAIAYVWVMMIMFGSLVLETFMIYPNIFHNPPDSLILAQEFLSVSGPNTFFPPLGMALWLSGAAALALSWRIKPARLWIALSLLMIVADGIVSIMLFWPRNQIMFTEGLSMHSAETLRQTAWEFVTLHWIRLALNAASAIFGFVGLYALTRWRLLTQSGATLQGAPLGQQVRISGQEQSPHLISRTA